ncbi:hypothetical protein EDD18DRAFT_1159662 [Armillaria luteobubalina]|uniref:DUF6533 domain-containing protein n=1 Tax=Armillaria luteobubalina TaxID=153913 RepID=A0AA39Q7R9_9AGAR|nr:hypothetical protein EDD18DRAFT_1159662 [Armillaria luteobubalina]
MSETATDIVGHVQATRYLTSKLLIYYSVLLYDHLLTFSTEVELIWAAHWSVPKAFFLLLRYIVPPSVIIHTHLLSGIANSHFSSIVSSDAVLSRSCVIWYDISMYLGQISVTISNFLVLLHLWNLWERPPLFICCTLALFTLTTIASIVCTTFVVLATSHDVYYDQALRTCALRARDRMPLLWAPCMAFEIVAFSTMVYNALSRPRSLHTDVGRILYRDGVAYFLVTLRLMNLLLAALAPVSLVLLGVFFIWSSTTVTVTRLILNLRESRIRTAKLQDGCDG